MADTQSWYRPTISQTPFAEVNPYSWSTQEHHNGSGIVTRAFYPYTDNGGVTLGVVGKDFVVMAGDTRNTSGYNINSRNTPKLFLIGGKGPKNKGAKMVLSVVGFAADGNSVHDQIAKLVNDYLSKIERDMSVEACARRLSHLLYYNRMFPKYTHCALGGIGRDGNPYLFGYDPVGSYEAVPCRASGAAASLLMPFLDNQIDFKNQYVPGSGEGHDLKEKAFVPPSKEFAMQVTQDAFTSATERHIEVGDQMQMIVITKDGVEEKWVPLKKD